MSEGYAARAKGSQDQYGNCRACPRALSHSPRLQTHGRKLKERAAGLLRAVSTACRSPPRESMLGWMSVSGDGPKRISSCDLRPGKARLSSLLSCAMVGSLALSMACKRGESSEKKGASESGLATKDVGKGASPKDDAGKEPGGRPIDLGEVRSVLEAWERSQNQGDFEAYRELYAERFVGIKRAQSRVFQADREDWLKDRETMFAKPMTVNVVDAQVTGAGGFARANFTQKFRTKTFSDEGPKELQLVQSAGGGWKIAREEMLSSNTGASGPPPKAIKPGDLSFVRQAAGSTLILLDRYASLNPVHGSVQYVNDGVVLRPVRKDLVEERYRSLVGRPFHVYDASGQRCELVPEELTIYGESYPHFGTLAEWNGQGTRAAYSPLERALATWEMIGDERWIALKSSTLCSGHWARLADAPSPEFLSPGTHSGPIEKVALASLKSTEGHRDLDSWATTNSKGADAWRSAARVFEVSAGTQFVFGYAEVGEGSCADYGGRHLAVFRRNGDSVVLLSDPQEGYGAGPLGRRYDVLREKPLPLLAMDLDRDGMPEFLFENTVFAFNGTHYTVAREARVLDFDCPC